MGESPYRSQPHVLLCPRCGDVFEELFQGVSSCVRCEGLWLAQPTIDRAFQDPLWPGGPAAWWRRELNCPVCATDGSVSLMMAILDGNVVVDRCRGHGMWLDAGELGRVLGTEDSGVPALYTRLFGTAMPPDMRRKLSGEEIAQRRREAAATRAWADKVHEERREKLRANQAKHDEWQQDCKWARENVTRLEAQLVRAREHLKEQERELLSARMLLRGLEANPPGGD